MLLAQFSFLLFYPFGNFSLFRGDINGPEKIGCQQFAKQTFGERRTLQHRTGLGGSCLRDWGRKGGKQRSRWPQTLGSALTFDERG